MRKRGQSSKAALTPSFVPPPPPYFVCKVLPEPNRDSMLRVLKKRRSLAGIKASKDNVLKMVIPKEIYQDVLEQLRMDVQKMKAEKRKLFKMYKQIVAAEKEQRRVKEEAIAQQNAASLQQGDPSPSPTTEAIPERAMKLPLNPTVTTPAGLNSATDDTSSTPCSSPRGHVNAHKTNGCTTATQSNNHAKRSHGKTGEGDGTIDRPKNRTKRSRWDTNYANPSATDSKSQLSGASRPAPNTAADPTSARKRKRKRRWSSPVHKLLTTAADQVQEESMATADGDQVKTGNTPPNAAFNRHSHGTGQPLLDYQAANRRGGPHRRLPHHHRGRNPAMHSNGFSLRPRLFPGMHHHARRNAHVPRPSFHPMHHHRRHGMISNMAGRPIMPMFRPIHFGFPPNPPHRARGPRPPLLLRLQPQRPPRPPRPPPQPPLPPAAQTPQPPPPPLPPPPPPPPS